MYISYSFSTSALDVVNIQPQVPASLYPWKRIPGSHWIWGWVSFRSGVGTEDRGKTFFFCRGSSPGRPICSRTL